jgi:tetratricopeptide (TPR) repeat protein
VASNEWHDEIFLKHGIARFARGDIDGASKDFADALASDPRCVAAYLGRGALRFRGADLDGALRDFTRIIELRPKALYRVHLSRGYPTTQGGL